MNWLITDDCVSRISTDSVGIAKQIPNGLWKIVPTKTGSVLERTEMTFNHNKIYGEVDSIVTHIIAAFKKLPSNKNLGVLLSGRKGMGKSLTTKIVVEKLMNDYPVIVVSQNTPDLSDMLSDISNAVIVIDEFEKIISCYRSDDKADEPTNQEKLLSVLDGVSGNAGNLFLLTCNELGHIDDKLKARPGRVKYHYRFNSISEKTIRDYCNDNLVRLDCLDELVSILSNIESMNLDIVTAIVQELNEFPDVTPAQVIDYFNIVDDSFYLDFEVIIEEDEGNVVKKHYSRRIDYTAKCVIVSTGYGYLYWDRSGSDNILLNTEAVDITKDCELTENDCDKLVRVTVKIGSDGYFEY